MERGQGGCGEAVSSFRRMMVAETRRRAVEVERRVEEGSNNQKVKQRECGAG